MSTDLTSASEHAEIHTEIEWGRTYRHQRKLGRRISIPPKGSPFDIKHMWEQYQLSKELADIRELKRILKTTAKTRVKSLQTKRVDPSTSSKKKYYKYMATPKYYKYQPDLPHTIKGHKKEGCSPRLIHLSIPKKVFVYENWKAYQHFLPIEFIIRLEELLHTDHNLDPKFARCYFKILDRKRQKQLRKIRNKCKRQKQLQKREDREWIQSQIQTTTSLLVKFLKKEPLFALNFKQMLLSEAILLELRDKGYIKKIPPRNTNKPYDHAIVDIVDQLSVWVDTITRYIDAQYTESLEQIVEVTSVESALGEEEMEEEEEEEEEKIKKPQRFSLPPLPPLPEMPPLPEIPGMMPQIVEEVTEELENDTTYGTLTAIETIFAEVEDGTEATLANLALGDDTLDILISILSNSTKEMLEKFINPDVLPNVTYQDILITLQNLRDKIEIERKKERQNILEQAMIEWVKSNEPDKMNDKMLSKIQNISDILSECLGKKMKVVKPEPGQDTTEITWPSGEESTFEDKVDTEALDATENETEELSSVTNEGVVDVPFIEGGEDEITESMLKEEVIEIEGTGAVEDESKEMGEPEAKPLDTLAEESDVEDLEEGSSLPVVKPEISKTELPLITETQLDMTGELNVVLSEKPEIDVSQMLHVDTMHEDEEEKEKELSATAAKLEEVSKASIPKVIPGHQPSKVFEHQPDTICCLTLKVWATWLLEVAHNAQAWSRWLNDIINEVRRIAAIIRGEIKDEAGNPVVFYKEDWREFSEKVDNMITSWRQYSMHVKDLTEKIASNFRGKTVTCCPKCLEDNLIVDVTLAHNISQQLAEAMNTAGYWRRWLDDIVMETKRLTNAALADRESLASSYGTVELIELHEPQTAESEESLYEIEELDPNNEGNTH